MFISWSSDFFMGQFQKNYMDAPYRFCIFFKISSSAGQKGYCGISSGVIQRRLRCSSFCKTPSSITDSNTVRWMVISEYTCITCANIPVGRTVMPSSSRHSRTSACSGVSPASAFPPANSQSRALVLFSGRWQIKNRFSFCFLFFPNESGYYFGHNDSSLFSVRILYIGMMAWNTNQNICSSVFRK